MKHPRIKWDFAAAGFLLSNVNLTSATSLQIKFPSLKKKIINK